MNTSNSPFLTSRRTFRVGWSPLQALSCRGFVALVREYLQQHLPDIQKNVSCGTWNMNNWKAAHFPAARCTVMRCLVKFSKFHRPWWARGYRRIGGEGALLHYNPSPLYPLAMSFILNLTSPLWPLTQETIIGKPLYPSTLTARGFLDQPFGDRSPLNFFSSPFSLLNSTEFTSQLDAVLNFHFSTSISTLSLSSTSTSTLISTSRIESS